MLAKDGGEEVLSCVASLPFCFGFTSSLVPNPVCRTPANKVAADVQSEVSPVCIPVEYISVKKMFLYLHTSKTIHG